MELVWHIPLDGVGGAGMNDFTFGRSGDKMKFGVKGEWCAK